MRMKHMFAFVAVVLLAAAPALAQFPNAAGNETTQSFGQFQILVEPSFAPLFAGCPGWDPATRVLTSPLLYDPGTVIGVSAAFKESGPGAVEAHPPGIDVGVPPTKIWDNMMSPPGGFPAPANGTREIHTQVRSLNMTGGGVTVSLAPGTISAGEVDSHSNSGNPANDFPARSFFDVYVQIGLPHCGGLPAGTTNVINRHSQPLKVEADGLTSLPPVVVYMHDTTTTVPIVFAADNGKVWKRDEPLGCLVLAGHGVGVQNTPAQREQFERHMKEHGRPARACTGGPIIKPGPVRPVRPVVPK